MRGIHEHDEGFLGQQRVASVESRHMMHGVVNGRIWVFIADEELPLAQSALDYISHGSLRSR